MVERLTCTAEEARQLAAEYMAPSFDEIMSGVYNDITRAAERGESSTVLIANKYIELTHNGLIMGSTFRIHDKTLERFMEPSQKILKHLMERGFTITYHKSTGWLTVKWGKK
jgi:hypothetical protein